MKAALISLESGSTLMLLEAMRKRFEEVDLLDIREIEVNLSRSWEILYKGRPIGEYDCVYAKSSFRYEPLLTAITRSLQGKSYLPIQESAFHLAHDKIATQISIQDTKIPMPTTYLAATIPAARKMLKKVNYPIMMKFPRGTQGKGVLFAETFATASSILDALSQLRQPFLIQEHIETGGEDIRLIVAGEKILAAMKRKAEPGEERANIHAGGKGESFSPGTEMRRIAVLAAKAIGAELCAVDLLESVRGPVVVEINLSPGLQGITEATGVDVAGKIADFLHGRTMARKGSENDVKAKKLLKDLDAKPGHDIITLLDYRGERILLPDLATRMSGLKEEDEVTLTIEKGKICVKKF